MDIQRPTLSILKSWASEAGKVLRDGYGKRHQIRYKGVADLVTEIDQRSEDLLVSKIRQHYPTHSILAEESGRLNGDHDSCWCIDPLDGTTNYAHGLPFFSVSLAYAEKGKVQMGVVLDPMLGECFSAERGKGAWLNDESIHVSKTSNLIEGLLATSFPYEFEDSRVRNLNYFSRFIKLTQSIRRMGSAALELCYVGAGRLDGYWEVKLHPWDVAAGGLIVEEAGGVVTNLDGTVDYVSPPCATVAANPMIHRHMMAVMEQVAEER